MGICHWRREFRIYIGRPPPPLSLFLAYSGNCNSLKPLLHIAPSFSISDNKILEALRRCEPEPLLALTPLRSNAAAAGSDPASSASPANAAKYKIISTLSDFYDRELVGTIGWAKQIPGRWVPRTQRSPSEISKICSTLKVSPS